MNFPLAYTQVVTFAVYFYFFAKLWGDQYLIPDKANLSEHTNLTNISFVTSGPYSDFTPNFVVPLFTLVEFFCYVGWMKVAATLLNPFGDDDEDFQMNYLIDRNLQVSYLIVDQASRDLNTITDYFFEGNHDAEVVEKVMANRAISVEESIVGKTVDAIEDAFDSFAEGITDNFKRVTNLSWRPDSPNPKHKKSNENNTTSIALEPVEQQTFHGSYDNKISLE